MFTPMNGRRAFGRIRRQAEDEWMSELNSFSRKETPETQKILFDSITFYLSYTQYHHSNMSKICHDGQDLLDTYSKKSLHWRYTTQHIFNGMFKMAEHPAFCNFL